MSDEEEDAWQAEGEEEKEEAGGSVQRTNQELAKDIFGDSEDESDEEPAKVNKKEKKKEKTKEKKEKKQKKEKGKAEKTTRAGGSTTLFAALGEGGSDDEAGGGDGFIDDHGVADEDRDDRNDDAQSVSADEADEDNGEFDLMFESKMGKRKKSSFSAGEVKSFVEAFLGKMDLAVDQDAEANQQGRPAIHKLVMLKEVEEVLENIHLHEDLLEAGLLNILKQWLEPLGDGSIPNVNVRTTLLRLLKKLPINVEMFDRREQLKKSGLGRMIMFYYKLPEESLTNKRTAQWLVEKWSRPIFELSTRYEELHRIQADERAQEDPEESENNERKKGKQRAAGGAYGEGDLAGGKDINLKPGDAGYRNRAIVPRPSEVDYVHRPKHVALVDGLVKARNVTGAGDGSKKAKITQKLLKLKMSGRKKDVHAMKVSIQGRGVAHGIVQ